MGHGGGPRPASYRRASTPLARACPSAGSSAFRRTAAMDARRRRRPSGSGTATRKGTRQRCRGRVTRTPGSTLTPRTSPVEDAPSSGLTCRVAASATRKRIGSRAAPTRATGRGGATRARALGRHGAIAALTRRLLAPAPVPAPTIGQNVAAGSHPAATGSYPSAAAAAQPRARRPTRAALRGPILSSARRDINAPRVP